LNYFDLIKSIEEGQLAPLYIFYGEEDYLLAEALKEIKNKVLNRNFSDLNYYEFSGLKTGLSEILAVANEFPLLGSKILIVVGDAIWLEEGKKEELKLLTDYLINPNSFSVLVFITKRAPKRLLTDKEFSNEARIVEFKPLKGAELNRWVLSLFQKKGIKSDAAALDYLLTACGENLRLLTMETEKLEAYLKEGEKLSLTIVKEIVGQTAPVLIFDLLDALMKQETGKALFLAERMLSGGETPVRLNFMMARQFRLALTAKILEAKGLSPKEVMTEMKIRPFEARKIMEQAKNYTMEELIAALEKLRDLDFLLKTGGDKEALFQAFFELGTKLKEEKRAKM